MAISTNSIIHYTDTLEKLQSILTEGFSIKYCAESLQIEDKKGSQAAHPMISFCDIPLSQSFKHFDAYGKYGIGLTKTWAYEMGINPVLYLESKSLISRTIGELLVERRKSTTRLTAAQKSSILHIKSFTKNYSGPLKRKSVDEKNYRFYDEREWRLVPDKSALGSAKFSINLNDYLDNKDYYNKLVSKLRFGFEAKDIAYIIVDKTSEIPEIIKLLKTEYYNRATTQELDILLSKIASTEQIISDY